VRELLDVNMPLIAAIRISVWSANSRLPSGALSTWNRSPQA
jgi:hypothetical protein